MPDPTPARAHARAVHAAMATWLAAKRSGPQYTPPEGEEGSDG
jgi:hypothetical protein